MEPRNHRASRTNPLAPKQWEGAGRPARVHAFDPHLVTHSIARAVRRLAIERPQGSRDPGRDADNGVSRNRVRFTAFTMLGLPQGTLLRLEDARGAQIRVEHGAVWITQDGDTADYVVRSGESIRLDRDGVALLTACGGFASTLISIEPRPCVSGTSSIPSPLRWAFHRRNGGGPRALSALLR